MNETISRATLEQLDDGALESLRLEIVSVQESRRPTAEPPHVVRCVWENTTASGRRKGWAKLITGIVDDDGVHAVARGAKAFVGDYLNEHVEVDLPVGTLILDVEPSGSVKNGTKVASIRRVEEDPNRPGMGWFPRVTEQFDWFSEFLSFRDEAKRVLEERGQ